MRYIYIPGLICFLWGALLPCSALSAQEQSLHDIIDDSLRQAQGDLADRSASVIDDYGFARRVYLDLTGRIPSPTQLASFVESEQANKREVLVDQLLNTPEYARHLQYVFDVMFMERLPKKHVAPEDFQGYLRTAFSSNKPYDALASEILGADGSKPELRPASRFLLDREIKREESVRAIGRIFLGRDLQCAQCHNHPNVDDYLQQHYFGVAAFLQRSYLFTDPKSKVVSIGDKVEGDVKFTSVFTGEESQTQPRILELAEIVDPEPAEEPYEVKPDTNNRGIPKYTRRLQLAPAMVDAGNTAFRQNIVNRIWAMLMGQGFVEPLDMFHLGNPPSHPELLELLADDFMQQRYDLKYLIKELVMTQAYQRESEFVDVADAEERPLYLNSSAKPLSPEQFAWSLMQAVGVVEQSRSVAISAVTKENESLDLSSPEAARLIEEKVHAALKPSVDKVVGVFAASNAASRFDASANHALYLLNGPEVSSWLATGKQYLLDDLLKSDHNAEVVNSAYLAIYSRLPSEVETGIATAFIEQSEEGREEVIRELVRTLLCSAEFRFNK